MYQIECFGPEAAAWAVDEPRRRFDHLQTPLSDGRWWHRFDVLAETPQEARDRVCGALASAGAFDHVIVSRYRPTSATVEALDEIPALRTLSTPARVVMLALVAGAKPRWIIQADPDLMLDAECLNGLLAALCSRGYVVPDPSGQASCGSERMWALTDRARRLLGATAVGGDESRDHDRSR